LTGYYNTFVIRLWCEEAAKQMKGRIEHTATHEHAYFNSLEDMNEFIRKHPGKHPNSLIGREGGEHDSEETEIVKLKKIKVQRRIK
jgi:hypothetical protein